MLCNPRLGILGAVRLSSSSHQTNLGFTYLISKLKGPWSCLNLVDGPFQYRRTLVDDLNKYQRSFSWQLEINYQIRVNLISQAEHFRA